MEENAARRIIVKHRKHAKQRTANQRPDSTYGRSCRNCGRRHMKDACPLEIIVIVATIRTILRNTVGQNHRTTQRK